MRVSVNTDARGRGYDALAVAEQLRPAPLDIAALPRLVLHSRPDAAIDWQLMRLATGAQTAAGHPFALRAMTSSLTDHAGI